MKRRKMMMKCSANGKNAAVSLGNSEPNTELIRDKHTKID